MKFQKGHKLATGRPAGSKNVTTLLKEERRAAFEAYASENWQKIMEQLPPTYIADQFMGKAAEEININTKMIKVSLSADLTDALKKELKNKLINEIE